MAMRALGVAPHECSLRTLRTRVPSTSVWTVDLVHIICSFGIKFRFLTTTIGVNPEYKNEAFYNKTLDADRDRVSDLFERASGSGIEIERRSVSDEELSELTGAPHDSLVMALVDRRYLYRSPPNSVSGFLESCFTLLHDSWAYGGGYIGHYVLLTGFDKARDGYYLLDPAKERGELFVHSEHLHAARRAHGTDEDLIVIPWDQPAAVHGEQREPLAKCSTSAVAAAG